MSSDPKSSEIATVADDLGTGRRPECVQALP
jgi:hypothetical protein